MADTPKKQIPLRLSQSLYEELSVWAEEDFRSLNGQIEFLLTQCIRHHRQNGQSDSASGNAPNESAETD